MPKKALAKFDDANVIATRLRALGVATNLFGRYTSHSSSEICSLLNGTKRLTKDKADILKAAVADLELVQRMAFPIPVNFTRVDDVLNAVAQLKSGELLYGKVSNGIMEVHGITFDGVTF